MYYLRVNVANGTGRAGPDAATAAPRISDFDSRVTSVDRTGNSYRRIARQHHKRKSLIFFFLKIF